MESNSSDYYNKDNEEESLLENVASLRHELKITEWSLQNLGEELSSVSTSENSDYTSNPSRFQRLILEDLAQPSHPGHLNYSPYKKVCKLSSGNTDFRKKPKDKVSFESSTPMDQEIRSLREKLNKLRQQNACLVSQNHSLMTKIESIHFELTQSKAKVSILESAQQQAANVPILEEQIINLEAEVSAQDKVLREAEDKLEQSQKMVIEKEQSLQKFQEECIKLKVDLLEQSKQGKRAERQRNEALYNAEELSKAFQHYKEKVAEKLEKVQAEEEILEKNLINCEKENKRLQEKCGIYKSEVEILKEKLRQLKEENNIAKEKLRAMAVKNSEVVAQLTESRQNVLKLESELQDKEEVLREKFSIMNENKELKLRITTQNERLDLCHQEIESSRVELRNLEKIISQLPLKREMFGFKSSLSKHQMSSLSNTEDSCIGCGEANKMMISELRIKLAIKEAEIQKLQANLTANQLSQSLISYNDNQESGKFNSLETEPVKLGNNQVAESIKDQSKQYEREKQKLAAGIEELRTKLMQIEAENSDLKVDMAHRTSQFQLIQEELLEKASNSSKLESEMTKKCSQLLTLEKQLEEKIVAYSSIAAKNAELEQELMEKNEKIRSLETNINTEHEKICLAFEKAKKIHLEQHKEMEKQIERLEVQLEKKDQQFKEQEKTMSMLQQDIICKHHHLESLDRLLTESKGEMEKENMKKDEALKALQNQVSEETIKVRQLDSALEICKEELALHLNQLEGNKEKFEKQLKKKSEEVYCLQKELKIKNHSLQETTEQNVILQHTLQQQQQMLQQETIRNGELEDIQTKLEKQVSKLEQELQKQRESSAEKIRKMEDRCETATREADLKRQKIIELTGIGRQVKLEMDQCKEELSRMEKEIMHLKRDGENKAIHISQLDMILEQTKTELDKKTNAVKELEKLHHQTETELTEASQKREALETELQNAHGELKSTLRQLQELRDVLQKAQLSLEEKYTTIKDLTAELSSPSTQTVGYGHAQPFFKDPTGAGDLLNEDEDEEGTWTGAYLLSVVEQSHSLRAAASTSPCSTYMSFFSNPLELAGPESLPPWTLSDADSQAPPPSPLSGPNPDFVDHGESLGDRHHQTLQISYEALKDENSKLSEVQSFSETQTEMVRTLERKLEAKMSKEERDYRDPESVVQQVEQSLELMTKQAVKVESNVLKLKQEVSLLQAQVSNFKHENEALRCGQGASLTVVKQHTDMALQNLRMTEFLRLKMTRKRRSSPEATRTPKHPASLSRNVAAAFDVRSSPSDPSTLLSLTPILLVLAISSGIHMTSSTSDKLSTSTPLGPVIKEQEQYIATQYKDTVDLGQELTLTREQLQNSHTEMVEARRQQVQGQREIERLSSELEEIKQLSKEKEVRGNHLAEELGASQVREAQLEARMQAEIKKLSAEVGSLKEAYHREMLSHQENHAKWRMSADSQKTSVQQLNEQLEKAKLELEDAQDTVSNLHQQVQDRNEVIEAANEALLIKESELTRLQAKISGHERAEGMKFLSVPAETVLDIQDPKFGKHSHTSFFKCKKLRRSISASDLSFRTHADEDLSEELLQDLKKMQLEQPSALQENQKDLTYNQLDSFDPLIYNLEDDNSESNDFNTLSGMLKYINKEVRLLKKSSVQIGAGLTQILLQLKIRDKRGKGRDMEKEQEVE
ncbi:coiled-coil domain-containing protein 18 [Orycteropus afer afer]|uniref:Coiled-coil domain-containing protein 18 n=1 Tax=Orycteropus afer afer TaxID=1230840 RepID=A0A8B6ZF64_ORYAF|nr:coiled-coil domain-containing protein 18 [Orycteropus afer afer]